MSTTELLNRQVAAEWLAEQLQDKNAEQWALWLRNNANTARRASYRIPTEQIGRGTFYNLVELEKFAEFEKGRQLGQLKLTGRAAEVLQAFGTGTEGATTNGRKWKGASTNLGTDKGAAFVQTIINEPLVVFAMTAAQAIDFGRELIEAGRAAQRINGEAPQQSPQEGYKVLTSTPATIIKRKG